MKKRDLVIVRAGKGSLHREWLAGERDWDLVISGYDEALEGYQADGFPCFEQRGTTKYPALQALLGSGDLDWSGYEYVWLPDDDLRTTAANINGLFAAVRAQQARLAQPALDWASHASHLITMQHKGLAWRRTNFVEVMAPVFRADFLKTVLPTFTESRSGFGLDFLWPFLLGDAEYFGALIVDSHPVTHTRPVGSAGHGSLGAAATDPQQEMLALMQKWGIKTNLAITAMACDGEGRVIDLLQHRAELLGRLFLGLQERWGQEPVLMNYLLLHARLQLA